MALRRLWGRTSIGDRLVVLGLLLLSLLLLVLTTFAPAGSRVVVRSEGRVVYTAPLTPPRSVVLPGPLGDTEITIAAGKVAVSRASCPLKVCMRMGAASQTGDLIACVPNRLVIRIEGPAAGRRGDYDLLSR